MTNKGKVFASDESLQAAITALLTQHSDLSIHGWHGDSNLPLGHSNHYDPSSAESYKREPDATDRERIAIGNVRTALVFLERTASFRKTINTKIGSYGLKHHVERWGAQNGMSTYVANGELIVAALLAGFEVKRSRTSGPNCYFNIGLPRDVRSESGES